MKKKGIIYTYLIILSIALIIHFVINSSEVKHASFVVYTQAAKPNKPERPKKIYKLEVGEVSEEINPRHEAYDYKYFFPANDSLVLLITEYLQEGDMFKVQYWDKEALRNYEMNLLDPNLPSYSFYEYTENGKKKVKRCSFRLKRLK